MRPAPSPPLTACDLKGNFLSTEDDFDVEEDEEDEEEEEEEDEDGGWSIFEGNGRGMGFLEMTPPCRMPFQAL